MDSQECTNLETNAVSNQVTEREMVPSLFKRDIISIMWFYWWQWSVRNALTFEEVRLFLHVWNASCWIAHVFHVENESDIDTYN